MRDGAGGKGPSSAPRWARWLLSRLAGPARADDVVGDLEEAHRARAVRRGRVAASLLTGAEALDMAVALVRLRRAGSLRTGSVASFRVLAGRRPPLVSWLDVKLGVRMLLKHPGLSVVSVLGMAVAVAIGASAFGVIRGMTSSPLPLHEGDRVVTIQNVAELGFEQARETHLHRLDNWRRGLPALEDLGAYRIVSRNLVTADGAVAPARVVEMTASGFRIARVPPLLGRPLIEADEREGASPVAVIGHGVWQDRFGGSADVVGRILQIGATRHEVVGVMPPGFRFPINNRVWTPLRLDPGDYAVGDAPAIDVFGRLAPGATLEEATAQLAVLGERAAAEHPEPYARVEARAYPYAQELVWGPMSWVLYLVQLFVSGLLVVIAVNVAALVYARTASRAGEISVRSALGAGRARIASQLFAESFVLSALAAGAGLAVARIAVARIEAAVRADGGEQVPFWWDFSLSAETLAYGLGLAVLAAVIIGVVPALGATGRRLRDGLQTMGAGASGPKLGKTWGALIVAQIALAVAILPVALSGATRWGLLDAVADSGYPLEEVLVARLALDDDGAAPTPADRAPSAASPARAGERRGGVQRAGARDEERRVRQELVRRFEAMGEVARVAVMATSPWEDPDEFFEMDGRTRSPLATPMQSASTGHRVGRTRVQPAFFEAFDIPVLSGRALTEADAAAEEPPVLVNRPFVDLVLGGGNPLGRRIRFLSGVAPNGDRIPEGPWHTIVGVVPTFPPSALSNPEAKAFIPVHATAEGPVSLAVRVRGGDAAVLRARLRRVAAQVDPLLRLEGVETLAMRMARQRRGAKVTILTVVVLSLAVLLLAVAGLYALMSFTVVRRRREIGIRTALGARPARVMRSVLARAGRQLAVGVVVGLGLSVLLDRMAGGELVGGKELVYFPVVAGIMALVGLAAAWGPARRGLRVQPTEALKAD